MTKNHLEFFCDRGHILGNQTYKIYRCDPVKQLTMVFYNIISLSVIRSPVHSVVPLPVNPFLHVQLYEPTKFSHVTFVSQGLELHSSMSEKIKHKF